MNKANLKNAQEIQCMRESAAILSKVHGEVAAAIQPGISKRELNAVAEHAIQQYDATPSFKGYKGFPAALCVSVNSEVVHVIPDGYVLEAGDIVTVDCGVFYKGFHSDSAFTHVVGKVGQELLHLLAVTKEALYKGIAKMCVGNHIGDVGHAIQQHVEQHGYSIVKAYTGHGIGREVHEKPYVYNYGNPGEGVPIQEGMVVAIEPIVNMGSPEVYQQGAWNVLTKDGKPSCHFEHTVAVVDGQPEMLTTYDYIEKKQYLV